MLKKRIIFYGLFLLIILVLGGCSLLPNPTPATYTIEVISGENGSITPGESTIIKAGNDLIFSIIANEGYIIADILVDGESILVEGEPFGQKYTYTFKNVQGDHTIEVIFDKITHIIVNKYTLNMKSDPPAGGTATDVTGTGPYFAGTVVSISAAANEGYNFVKWNSVPTVTFANAISDNTTFTMPAQNVEITANFALKTYTVTFKDWDGTVLKTQIVNHGSAATAPTDPDRGGYTFTGWDVPFDNITGDLTVTAQYEQNTYTLIIYIAGDGQGTTSPAENVQHTYLSGDNITIAASPSDDCNSFSEWSGDISSTNNPYSINMDDDKTIYATFLKKIAYNYNTGVSYYSTDTIQKAIDEAQSGETVYVCPGTYEENLVFENKNITLQSYSSPEDTILDGGGDGSVVTFTNGDTSTLSGFTITNGTGTFYDEYQSNDIYFGGGILVIDNSFPVISDNIITGNTTGYGGGIMVTDESNADIINNTISDNTSKVPPIENGDGGGIAVFFNSDATITGNEIKRNSAWKGAGITVYDGSTATISDNDISENEATTLGGGILVFYDSDADIDNNSITENSAKEGGGINISYSSTAVIEDNNVISNNHATAWGGGIIVYENSSVTIRSNIISSNAGHNGGGIYVGIDSFLLPNDERTNGWGQEGESEYRRDIPYQDGEDLVPPADEDYAIAGNILSKNLSGSPLSYKEGSHVYFVKAGLDSGIIGLREMNIPNISIGLPRRIGK